MNAPSRLQTGIPELDDLLGGGLLPGKLTVVLGATGVGKTQLGLQFAEQGRRQEGQSGIFFDMTARGDSQNHREYAERMFGWNLESESLDRTFNPEDVFTDDSFRTDQLHLFDRTGRRVTIGDLDFYQWKEWKAELAKKLDRSVAFFYGNFIRGVRRLVIDGVEPADRDSDSFQMHVFDYVYHQILHKEADWVARDLLRVKFRVNEQAVANHMYDHRDIGCVLMQTTHEVMLDEMLARPIVTGDVLSNANTIIMMGKVRDGNKMGRALHVAKHRGSPCDESIVPFTITETGLKLG